jgi:transposase InsO family protein
MLSGSRTPSTSEGHTWRPRWPSAWSKSLCRKRHAVEPSDIALAPRWEFLFVAVDDHARVAYTAMHPDERTDSAVQFLRDAVAYYNRQGVTIKRLLTDNGSAFRSKPFKAACEQLGIQHKYTRAYRPQTNGKAERFIQSALREWAYGWACQNSAERREALHSWQHHYNWHRPHRGIGRVAPAFRLPEPRHNVLTAHS